MSEDTVDLVKMVSDSGACLTQKGIDTTIEEAYKILGVDSKKSKILKRFDKEMDKIVNKAPTNYGASYMIPEKVIRRQEKEMRERFSLGKRPR